MPSYLLPFLCRSNFTGNFAVSFQRYSLIHLLLNTSALQHFPFSSSRQIEKAFQRLISVCIYLLYLLHHLHHLRLFIENVLALLLGIEAWKERKLHVYLYLIS